MLNACPRSRRAPQTAALRGVKHREESQGPAIHPPVTGEGKSGRVNEVNLGKPRDRRPRRWMFFWGTGSPLGCGSAGWGVYPARRAPRPRGKGGARYRTQLAGAERGNPVTVRRERPPAGRRSAELRAGTGRPRSEGRLPKGDRKAGACGRTLRARPRLYNWPHTGPGGRARKGADVSRVAP